MLLLLCAPPRVLSHGFDLSSRSVTAPSGQNLDLESLSLGCYCTLPSRPKTQMHPLILGAVLPLLLHSPKSKRNEGVREKNRV